MHKIWNIGKKVYSFITALQISQSSTKFDKLTDILEFNLDLVVQRNPYLVVVLGYFNWKPKNWCGSDKTNFEGNVIRTLFSQFGIYQMANNSTYLIFTSQPSFIVEAGVHPSLHPNSHHQVFFARFNIKLHYPPPYYCQVWHYAERILNLSGK